MTVLTPNALLLYGQSTMIPEKQLDKGNPETKRCQRYINKCQEAAWKRWKKKFCDPFKKGTI